MGTRKLEQISWFLVSVAVLFAAAFLLAASLALAVEPVNADAKEGAIKGFDPVAYFTEGKPVKGKKDFRFDWMGAAWYFASAQNRDLFQKEPGKYAPQYGGYCAYAVSQGSTAPIDPDAWTIHNGKLYLNYSQRIKKTWEKDIPGYIAKADQNWPKILNGKK
jgi:YHS domain-containing protein